MVEAIAGNPWLNLTFVESREPDFIFNNIKKSLQPKKP